MSEDRSRRGFLRGPEAGNRTLREDAQPASTPIGYDPGNGGNGRAWPGDEKLPFFMQPVDHEKPFLYLQNYHDIEQLDLPLFQVANALDEFYRLPGIDVTGYRTLTLFVEFFTTPIQDANALSFIPQFAVAEVPSTGFPDFPFRPYLPARPDNTSQAIAVEFEKLPPDMMWHTISVVDPVLRGTDPVLVTSPDASMQPPQYAFRNVYHTQLNFRLNTQTAPNPLVNTYLFTSLVFDVTPYQFFRFLVGATNSTPSVLLPPIEENAAPLVRFFIQLGR